MTKTNRIQTLLEHTPFPGAGQTLGKIDVIESVVDLPGRNWEIHFRGNLTKSAVKNAIKDLVAHAFALPISDEYSLVGFRPRGFTHARSNPGGDVTIVRGHMYYARPNPTTSEEFQTEMDDMLITNPEKYFNKYSAKTPEALRTKLFSFVSLTGESYGWHMPNGDVHHRRASIIMPKIKINKALKGAKMFYHTHPSKDEPSLTSADDYQFYLDLHFAWGITTFYTIMKHKMDKFTIKSKPGGKEKYLRMEEETFCNAVDGLIDLGEKKALTEVDASAPDTDYQNKTTANMIAAFNKKYKSIAEISFRAFVKPHAPSTLAQKAATGTEAITGIRSNPRPNPPIKVEDKYIAKALQELKGLDYAFEHYGGDEYAHTMYVYWWLKHHLYPTPEYVSGRLFKLNDYGMDSDTRQKLRAYLSQTIIGNWTYLDATMLLGLYHDIAKLREKEQGARKGWEIGAQMFLTEVGPELGLPAKLTEDLTHVLETDIGRKGISDKAFATQVGAYYGVSKLVQMADLMAHHPLMYTALARQAKEGGLMEASGGDNFKTLKMKDYSADIVKFLNEGEIPRSNPLPRARYVKWIGKYSSGNFDSMVVEENLHEFDQRYVADEKGKMNDSQGGSGGQFFYMRFNNGHLDDIPTGKVIKAKLSLRSGTFDVDVSYPPRDFGEELAQKLYVLVGKELKASYPDLELETVETEAVVNPRKAARVQVITLSGPSGGGKTTVLKYLSKKLPNASTPPTYTTRPRRPREQGAHDRRFVSKERFHEMVEKSMFVEWVQNPNGHFYGRIFDDFRGDFAIVDVSLKGKKLYEKRFPNVFSVFLDPHPSYTTKARAQALHRRGGMSKAEAKKRAMGAANMVKASRSIDFDLRVTMKPGAYDQGAKKVLSEIPMDNPRVPWADIDAVDVPDLARGLERINADAHRKRVRINTQYGIAVEFNRILEVQDPNYIPFIGPRGAAEYSKATKIGKEKQGLVPIGEAADLEAEEINTSLDRWTTRTNPKTKLTVRIQESTKPEKKLMAVFTKPNGRTKTTHFGARGMSDYTQHKDPKRMKNYLARHGGMGEDWNDPVTAGALSRWILWGKPSLRESFNDYKKKFNIEGVMAVTNTRMNPKAPGYNSYAWTTQDWRSIKVNSKGDIDYSEKCGAEGTRTKSGKPRLCLAAPIIRSLMKTESGKEVLRTQARKKLKAKKGERVPWHPRIKKLHKKLEERTPEDR